MRWWVTSGPSWRLATVAALACLCAASCGDATPASSDGEAPARGEPSKIEVSIGALSPNRQTLFLVAGGYRSLLVRLEPTAATVEVVDHASGASASTTSLPDGFVPDAGYSNTGHFWLIGNTCAPDTACRTTLLRSSQSDIQWTDVPIDPAVGVGGDSSIDAGVVDDSIFLATGVPQRPAMFVLNDTDGTWSPIAHPAGGGAYGSLCSTNGLVYSFDVKSQQVFVLGEDRVWTKGPERLGKGISPGDGLLTSDTLCSAGTLILGRTTAGAVQYRLAADGALVRTVEDVPPWTPALSGGFTPAGIVPATGQLVHGPNPAEADAWTAPPNSTLLAASETPAHLEVLTSDPSGTAQLWIWPDT